MLAPPKALQIEDATVDAHTAMNEAMCDMFEQIVLADFHETYTVDGARTIADWVSYRFGCLSETAREYVAVAKALDFLPAIKSVFREGLLSWDHVRFLSSFVTFAEDVEWSQKAIGMHASEVRAEALERKRITREMADARLNRRYLRSRREVEDGGGGIWGRLPDYDYELVMKAIDRRAKRGPSDLSLDRRRADALVEICSMAVGADADPDRANVVVHVDHTALVTAEGIGMLEGGTPIANETVRRISCDSRLQMVLHTTEGIIASRTTRTVPASMSRELRRRDGKCVFRGCDNDVWVDAHHIAHFADGGETVLENLALLCGFHHRLVHEGGWTMHVTAEGDFVFVRPDGRPLFAHNAHGSEAPTVATARAP